jgi:hypothetical protein
VTGKKKSALTIIGENLDLAEAQTSLDSDELNGHELSDEWAGASERLSCSLVKLSRLPGAQRIALEISAAIADADLEILQWTVAAAASRRDPHDSDRLRREKIDAPPGRYLFLGLGALLTVGNLISWLAIVSVERWTRSRRR